MKTDTLALPTTRSRVEDFLALTKPRLNSLVLATTGVGYYLGSTAGLDLLAALHTVMGTGLVAGGAAAFNQLAERDLDEVMDRTRWRPIPAGRVQASEAGAFAVILTIAGLTQLALGTNRLAATIALVTLVSYAAIYTPLKRRTHWATVVGAFPGALPPVIGWVAARGTLTAEAWALFGIVFVWQLPHFYALAWLYREDFRRAQVPLIAVLDNDGRSTARHILGYTVLLLPVSLTPAFVGLTGLPYLIGASALGVAFFILAARFAGHRTTERARSLFLGSLLYLPLLWGLLVVHRAL